jgi:hypothetical protein
MLCGDTIFGSVLAGRAMTILGVPPMRTAIRQMWKVVPEETFTGDHLFLVAEIATTTTNNNNNDDNNNNNTV